jgi:hypothetical protein
VKPLIQVPLGLTTLHHAPLVYCRTRTLRVRRLRRPCIQKGLSDERIFEPLITLLTVRYWRLPRSYWRSYRRHKAILSVSPNSAFGFTTCIYHHSLGISQSETFLTVFLMTIHSVTLVILVALTTSWTFLNGRPTTPTNLTTQHQGEWHLRSSSCVFDYLCSSATAKSSTISAWEGDGKLTIPTSLMTRRPLHSPPGKTRPTRTRVMAPRRGKTPTILKYPMTRSPLLR